MEEDWIDAYWVLFDTLWAVECAVTQRYVDIRRQTGVFGFNQIGVDTDETLEQLYQTRASLIISIFRVIGPMTPTPALLDSLAITLLDWSEDLDSFLSRQDSLIVSLFLPPCRLEGCIRSPISLATTLICTALTGAKLWEECT